MSSDESAQRLKNRALRLLSRREYGVAELRQKLSATEHDERSVAELLEWLQQMDWLSDERFAEHFVRSKCQSGYGPIRIRMELKQKGVADSNIQAALNQHEIDWFQVAQKAWNKRYKNPAMDWAERAKRKRFMQYRGFNDEQIRQAMSGSDED